MDTFPMSDAEFLHNVLHESSGDASQNKVRLSRFNLYGIDLKLALPWGYTHDMGLLLQKADLLYDKQSTAYYEYTSASSEMCTFWKNIDQNTSTIRVKFFVGNDQDAFYNHRHTWMGQIFDGYEWSTMRSMKEVDGMWFLKESDATAEYYLMKRHGHKDMTEAEKSIKRIQLKSTGKMDDIQEFLELIDNEIVLDSAFMEKEELVKVVVYRQ